MGPFGDGISKSSLSGLVGEEPQLLAQLSVRLVRRLVCDLLSVSSCCVTMNPAGCRSIGG